MNQEPTSPLSSNFGAAGGSRGSLFARLRFFRLWSLAALETLACLFALGALPATADPVVAHEGDVREVEEGRHALPLQVRRVELGPDRAHQQLHRLRVVLRQVAAERVPDVDAAGEELELPEAALVRFAEYETGAI